MTHENTVIPYWTRVVIANVCAMENMRDAFDSDVTDSDVSVFRAELADYPKDEPFGNAHKYHPHLPDSQTFKIVDQHGNIAAWIETSDAIGAYIYSTVTG